MNVSVYLVIEHDVNEEGKDNGLFHTFLSIDEAMKFTSDKDNCELYVVSEITRLL